jgi:hypothetical protein
VHRPVGEESQESNAATTRQQPTSDTAWWAWSAAVCHPHTHLYACCACCLQPPFVCCHCQPLVLQGCGCLAALAWRLAAAVVGVGDVAHKVNLWGGGCG